MLFYTKMLSNSNVNENDGIQRASEGNSLALFLNYILDDELCW
jgi:hypothetical protein